MTTDALELEFAVAAPVAHARMGAPRGGCTARRDRTRLGWQAIVSHYRAAAA